MSAIDLVAFDWGRLRPLGGDRCRSAARLLRAAEMRLKTLGSDGGGGGVALLGRGGKGDSRGTGGAPVGPEETSAPAGTGPELSSPAVGGGENGSAFPPPGCAGPSLTEPPPVSQEVKVGDFGGLE